MTVPKNVRDQLDIKPGDKCYVWVRNREMVVVPRNQSFNDLAGLLGARPNGRKLTIDEMNPAVGYAVSEAYEESLRDEDDE